MVNMTLNQITAALAVVVLALVALLMWALAAVLAPADPSNQDYPTWITVQPVVEGTPV